MIQTILLCLIVLFFFVPIGGKIAIILVIVALHAADHKRRGHYETKKN